MDIVGQGINDHIEINVESSKGAAKKLNLGLQTQFKIGLYGSDALNYKLAEKNKN